MKGGMNGQTNETLAIKLQSSQINTGSVTSGLAAIRGCDPGNPAVFQCLHFIMKAQFIGQQIFICLKS
jgi:hypothetical protein